MSTKQPNRWLILIGCWFGMFTLGGFYCWSVFSKPLQKMFGWSTSSVTFAYTLTLIVMFFFGLIVGKLVDKYNPRYLMIAGMILWSGGWFLTGSANSIPALYILFGGIVGIGDGLIYTTLITTVNRWFPDKKGLASGILLSAAGISSVPLAPLANTLLVNFGVQNSFRYIGITFFVILAISCILIKDRPASGWKPEGWEPAVVMDGSGKTRTLDYNWKQMISQSSFWLMLIIYGLAGASGQMIIAHASPIGQQIAGLTAATAAVMVGINALFNFIGRIFWGAVSDKIGRYNALYLVLIITAIDMVLFGQISTLVPFMFCIALVGFCFAGVLITFPILCAERFGLKNLGLNFAILYAGYVLAAIIGPMTASYMIQTFGTYVPGFIVAAVLACVSVILTYILSVITKKQDSVYSTIDNQMNLNS